MISQELTEKLYEVLKKEYKLYIELVNILEKEKEAILEDDIKTVNELVLEGEDKIFKINFLEEERKKLLDNKFQNLDFFIKFLDSNEKEKFIELKKRLLSKIEELSHLKKTNELLINKILKYLRFYIELLSKETGSPVYGEGGNLSFNKKILNKLDERV